MTTSSLFLGSCCSLDGGQQGSALHVPAHHLATHAVVVGMTGSGKTGLLTVMVEEALREQVPVLMIDVKGDLPNLLLAFPNFASQLVEPWVEPGPADTRSTAELAAALAAERERGLTAWGIGERELRTFAETTTIQVITPGSTAGVPLHVLSSLENPVSDWTKAAALNTLLASPTFAPWRTGTPLDVKSWLAPKDGRTPAVIVSVAHLDDDERALVLGVLLEEVLTWVRSLPGSKRLRALIVFDEVYGFLPPHPANPPTKRPLVSLMKQARAFGVGVVIATQNPMDLDYRALGNAGMWCVARLQTDADRARVLEGLCTATNGDGDGSTLSELSDITKRLAPRWFLMRDVHSEAGTQLVQPRWAMSFMRGPMTAVEVRRASKM